MELIADLHTHTIACGHGYSTVEENIRGAQERGLLALAITEHGPCIPGGPHPFILGGLKILPKEIQGLRLLRGAELNILNTQGELDLGPERKGRLDFILAAFHPNTPYSGTSQEENTQALLQTLEDPFVDALAHPDNPLYPVDYAQVVEKAVLEGVMLELNNGSLLKDRPGRPSGYENAKRILELGKEHGLLITVGSDAHISFHVGNLQAAQELLQEVSYPPELVLNTSLHRIECFLEERQERIKKKLSWKRGGSDECCH